MGVCIQVRLGAREYAAPYRLLGLVVHHGQQAVEVLSARAARAQMHGDAGVALLSLSARRDHLGIDM